MDSQEEDNKLENSISEFDGSYVNFSTPAANILGNKMFSIFSSPDYFTPVENPKSQCAFGRLPQNSASNVEEIYTSASTSTRSSLGNDKELEPDSLCFQCNDKVNASFNDENFGNDTDIHFSLSKDNEFHNIQTDIDSSQSSINGFNKNKDTYLKIYRRDSPSSIHSENSAISNDSLAYKKMDDYIEYENFQHTVNCKPETTLHEIFGNGLFETITVKSLEELQVSETKSTESGAVKEVHHHLVDIDYKCSNEVSLPYEDSNHAEENCEKNVVYSKMHCADHKEQICIGNTSSGDVETTTETNAVNFGTITESVNFEFEATHEQKFTHREATNNNPIERIDIADNANNVMETTYEITNRNLENIVEPVSFNFETTGKQTFLEREVKNNDLNEKTYIAGNANKVTEIPYENVVGNLGKVKGYDIFKCEAVNQQNVIMPDVKDDKQENIHVVNIPSIIESEAEKVSEIYEFMIDSGISECETNHEQNVINLEAQVDVEDMSIENITNIHSKITSPSCQNIESIKNENPDYDLLILKPRNIPFTNCTSNTNCVYCIHCKDPCFDSANKSPLKSMKSEVKMEHAVNSQVNIKNLLDLFEIDNVLSKTILTALSSEFLESGVTQGEILKYLKKGSFSGTLTKLRNDIKLFFAAALNFRILYMKRKRYFLNVSPDVNVESRSKINRTDKAQCSKLENRKNVSKLANNQKNKSNTISDGERVNKSVNQKVEKIVNRSNIKNIELESKSGLPKQNRDREMQKIIQLDGGKGKIKTYKSKIETKNNKQMKSRQNHLLSSKSKNDGKNIMRHSPSKRKLVDVPKTQKRRKLQ